MTHEKFRTISADFLASPQIQLEDIEAAQAAGIRLIVNNRPDGEAPEEPQGTDIEAAARAANIDYLAIPITHTGFSLPQVEALEAALASADGTILAYCRSGTRSTLLWALAQAKLGMEPDAIAAAAMAAGYDITPVRPTVEMLAGRSSE